MKDWKQYERHPDSADYGDLVGPRWERTVAGLQKHGIVNGRKVILHEGKVIDGWQLYRACLLVGVKPDFGSMPAKMTTDEFMEVVNDNRRHESPDEEKKRIAERRKRVAAARAEGQSTRTIAEKEGVSQPTVLRDIAATDGDTRVSPKAPEAIKGRDSVMQSATSPTRKLCRPCRISGRAKPGCKECAAVQTEAEPPPNAGDAWEGPEPSPNGAATKTRQKKGGKVVFDNKSLTSAIGGIARLVEEAGKAYGKKAHYAKMREHLEMVLTEWKAWMKDIG